MLLLHINYLENSINQAYGMWEINGLRTNTMIHFLREATDSVKMRGSLALTLESLEPKYS